jgi:hypothetical protein
MMDMETMGPMMGLGMVGWVLVIALLVTIVVLLVRILGRSAPRERPGPRPPNHRAGDAGS